MIKLSAPLILASGSKARADMLRGAGLRFEIIPADIDEDIVKQAGGTPEDIARDLSARKALNVAAQNPKTYVIGADQILECGGIMLSKAADVEGAREKLKNLRGRTHRLISAVSVARGDDVLWTHADHADLTMRDFEDEFLEQYLAQAGAGLTRSVGAYELEALGVHLFDRIEGDYFTILGMPLLAVLEFLRQS